MTDEELNGRFDEMIGLVRGIETNLLKEFRKWAISFESRYD